MHRLLACFGSAEFGRCGLGPELLTSQLVPRVCVALAKYDIETAAAGGAHTLALTKGGLVFSFGHNTSGQCGHSPGDDGVTVSGHGRAHAHSCTGACTESVTPDDTATGRRCGGGEAAPAYRG
jgi:alpha-tubulin suppressor-like RCC1 family protein